MTSLESQTGFAELRRDGCVGADDDVTLSLVVPFEAFSNAA